MVNEKLCYKIRILYTYVVLYYEPELGIWLQLYSKTVKCLSFQKPTATLFLLKKNQNGLI